MHNILNLPDWNVTDVTETDDNYRIIAQPATEPTACTHCGVVGDFVRFGSKEQIVIDLPMHGKRVGLAVPRRWYRCKACGRTFSELLPDVDEGRSLTTRLIAWIEKQSLKRTFVSIADDVGISEATVRNIFRAHVNELEQSTTYMTPRWLGIDEIHLLHQPRCVLTNVEERTVIDLLETRDKKTVTAYLQRLPARNLVEVVAMDMWTPYRDAVRATMPQAKVVVDKFHIVKMANGAMELARKGAKAEMSDKQRRTLMHDRFILLKREADLKPEEHFLLETWTKNVPALGAAFRLPKDFFGHVAANIRADLNDWMPYLFRYAADPVAATTSAARINELLIQIEAF